MFGSSGTNYLDVSVRMLDGAVLRGSFIAGATARLEGILGSESEFIEFISKQGQRKFLAKHQIAYIEPVEPLRMPALAPKDARYTDCYTILGLEQGCNFEQAKAAFHNLAKTYHPDKYSGVELPTEVSRYMTDMFRQVNAAFTEIRSEIQAAA
ncbi:MAG: J domain-containing protein [Rhizobiaceae bacterium]